MKNIDIPKLYNAKREASFKTKLKMYLFFRAVYTKDISFENFNCSDVVELYTSKFCQYFDDDEIKLEDNTLMRVGDIYNSIEDVREELGSEIGV